MVSKLYRLKWLLVSLLSTLLVVIFFNTCENRDLGEATTFRTHEIHNLEPYYDFHVLLVDGCHYLFLELDRNNPHEGFGLFAHRGNCPNPVHKHGIEKYPPLLSPVLKGTPLRYIKNLTTPADIDSKNPPPPANIDSKKSRR